MTIDKKKLQPLLWSVVASWHASNAELQRHTTALDLFLGEMTVEEVALGLLAEIERLENYAELEAKGSDATAQDLIRLVRENRQLKAENETMRKDAERYRFVRNPIGTSSPLAIWTEGKMPLFSGMADAVVDEFMAKEVVHG